MDDKFNGRKKVCTLYTQSKFKGRKKVCTLYTDYKNGYPYHIKTLNYYFEDLTDMSEKCPELSLSNMSDEAYELENDTNLNNYSDYIINELYLRSERHFDVLKNKSKEIGQI